VHLTIIVHEHAKIEYFKVSITYHENVVRIRDNRTQFGMSINV